MKTTHTTLHGVVRQMTRDRGGDSVLTVRCEGRIGWHEERDYDFFLNEEAMDEVRLGDKVVINLEIQSKDD